MSMLTKKGYIDFCRLTPIALQNGHILPQMEFLQFSPKIMLFSKNLFNIHYLIRNFLFYFFIYML